MWHTACDTNGDGVVTEQELCRNMAGYAFCEEDYDDFEEDENRELSSDEWWEDMMQRQEFISNWYHIDRDQDEIVSIDDLKTARQIYSEWTDEQVTAEFNHYDYNGDGTVTFDEAWSQKKLDDEALNAWFTSLIQYDKDDGQQYLEEWEHAMDQSGLVDFSAADTDENWRLTKDEACPHFFSDYPSVCT